MPCIFTILNNNNPELKTCTICGKEIKSKFPPEKINARCKDDAVPDFPTIVEQAKNLGNSISNFALHGFSIATDELANSRMNICKKCDLFKENRCSICGCNMAAKVKIASSTCPYKDDEFPNGKWPID